MFRREDGRYYPSNEVYKKAKVKDNIKKLKLKYEGKKENHPNRWFRERIQELKRERKERMKRNKDYDEQTEIWREEERKANLAASIAEDKRPWTETLISVSSWKMPS